jgi:lipopolysaccharide transport system permease protein
MAATRRPQPVTSFSQTAAPPIVEITPERSVSHDFQEIVRYRDLLYFLVWRDIRVRYKQTALGVLWAILQPVGMMLVFSLFLGRFAHVPSNGIPYSLMVLAGLLPWQLFANALGQSSNSLVDSERLITKVYFPRLVIPLAAVASALPDFAIGFVLLLVLLPFYGIVPALTLLVAPLFVLLAALAALSAGLWLAALNVQYRDVRYVLGFLTQIWLFVTPVVYPGSVVPARWRDLYALNPMVGVVEGFRWSITGATQFPERMIAISLLATIVLMLGGLRYFHRMEETFADII